MRYVCRIGALADESFAHGKIAAVCCAGERRKRELLLRRELAARCRVGVYDDESIALPNRKAKLVVLSSRSS